MTGSSEVSRERQRTRTRTGTAGGGSPQKQLRPYDTAQIKILLLENVHSEAVRMLTAQGYQVEHYSKALARDVLLEKIRDVHVVGIRSKTDLPAQVLAAARKLLAVGCFCIGTNQVDLDAATAQGVVVFNSPFSNSRSVAELVIGEVIALARQLSDRTREMHAGTWRKVSKDCFEVRGKTLGIVGYGHIGSQVSVLAEAMGMSVLFYDVLTLMPLGRAEPVAELSALLARSDFVTLHVPETEDTKSLIGAAELREMRRGSYLINNARGSVVDLQALHDALASGHLAGAALDVFPQEPSTSPAPFALQQQQSDEEPAKAQAMLQGLSNVILTPHIGGSTEEAQRAIGVEVADALVRFLNEGRTSGSVNMPEVELRVGWSWLDKRAEAAAHHPGYSEREDGDGIDGKGARVLCIHRNVPGVLRQINGILSPFNIAKQLCDSRREVAYLMVDVETDSKRDLVGLYKQLEAGDWSIKTRILY